LAVLGRLASVNELLTDNDVDRLLRFPRGRSLRLARKGLIPHVELPDRSIRFERVAIDAWLLRCARETRETSVIACSRRV
jgi:hypothetical protein